MPPEAVRVTNPDKVFWPDEGYRKRDLVGFYGRIFPKLDATDRARSWSGGRRLTRGVRPAK